MYRLAIVCAVLTLCAYLTFCQSGDFATQRVQDKGGTPVAFDGNRAMGYLKDLCAIGPRISGTPGFTKQVELIRKHFTKFGAKVTRQEFTARQLSRKDKKPTPMVNLVVSWHPERKRRVILSTHYDTRPIADQEKDERKWHEPFLSANDGGSGVAFLMELAHHMKDLKTEVGVDFVFFDGEEYVFAKHDDYFFGSQHFAELYDKGKKTNPARYVAALLFDMIGGKGAKFPAEISSYRRARPLVEQVWTIAQELKSPVFLNKVGEYEVNDDHLALLDVGIPAIDIIDFEYTHWHKLSDTPANCSGEVLAQVSRVVTVWLQRVR